MIATVEAVLLAEQAAADRTVARRRKTWAAVLQLNRAKRSGRVLKVLGDWVSVAEAGHQIYVDIGVASVLEVVSHGYERALLDTLRLKGADLLEALCLSIAALFYCRVLY